MMHRKNRSGENNRRPVSSAASGESSAPEGSVKITGGADSSPEAGDSLRIRKKKKHPQLVILPLAAAVMAFLLITITGRTTSEAGSATEHLDLGNQYLADADYESAIAQFSRALEIDPANKDAKVALARAYIGSGDTATGNEILDEMTEDNAVDPQVAQQLLDLYKDQGDYPRALAMAQDLIHTTDEDTWYDEKTALIGQLLDAGTAGMYQYARGTDQELEIVDGTLMSRGANAVGQLGTAAGIGDREYWQTSYADAGFQGEPLAVFCAGRTSLVLDSGRNLWAAGDNRWGQEGLSYGSGDTTSGWQLLDDGGNNVVAFGGTGYLCVLKTNGQVYGSGTGMGSSQSFARVSALEDIIATAATVPDEADSSDGSGSSGWYNSYDEVIYMLDADGTLYREGYYNYSTGTSDWQSVASQVRLFTVADRISSKAYNGFVYVDEQDVLCGWNFSALPEGWQYASGNYYGAKPDFTVTALGANDTVLALLGSDGIVRILNASDIVTQADLGMKAVSLTGNGQEIVATLEDGTTRTCGAGQSTFQ